MKYLIRFSNLPFKPAENQIIYVENGYDYAVNSYIQTNYMDIVNHFKNNGFDFIYIPSILQRLREDTSIEVVQHLEKNSFSEFKSNYLLKWMLDQESRKKLKPCLLFYHPFSKVSDYKEAIYQFRAITLTSDTKYDDTNNLSNILNDISGSLLSYCQREPKYSRVVTQNDVTEALKKLSEKNKKLAKSLEEIGGELLKEGFGAEILDYIIRGQKKLSRLLITKDYRILLIDEGKIEIKLTFLPKAVYLLYLKHPEGIAFNCLADYKEELSKLYKEVLENSAIKKNFTPNREKSIVSLINLENNKVNDIRDKIRTSFVDYFKCRSEEHLANNYIINGDKGEIMRVCLDPDMVLWEEDIEKSGKTYQINGFTSDR